MDKQNRMKKGIIFALLTAVISGFAIFYSKISVMKIDPLILSTTRNLYVAGLLLFLVLISGKFKELKKINRKDWVNLLFIGLIGGGLPFYLFFTGLLMTTAQTANLIHKSLFVWVSLLGIFFLKEKLNLWYWVSFVLVVLGTYFFTPLKLVIGRGELMILGATLLWSAENIVAKKTLKNISSELVGLFRMGIGSFFLILVSLLTGKAGSFFTFNASNLAVIVIGGTILSFYVFCWYRALKYAPVSLVSLILTFSLVVGNVLSGTFTGIIFLPVDIYSSVIIGAGISFLILSYSLKLKTIQELNS